MNNQTISEVKLYDPTDQKTYTFFLSQEDAEKCRKDNIFAQSLLFHGKTVEENTDRWSNTENTENLEENTGSGSNTENTESLEENTGIWSNTETLALISAYEIFSEDLQHAKKRKQVWQNMANQLLSLGIYKTANKCEMKWRNLLRTYKSVKDKKSATGRGATRFAYFSRIDEILGSKPSISCSHTFNTNVDDENTETIVLTQNDNHESNHEKDKENSEQLQNPKKKMKKDVSMELKHWKIQYLKGKEESRLEKEKRKEEQIKNQNKLIELEEKKIALLEKLINRERE